MNIAVLENAGIDYKKGVERYLDDAELFEEVLAQFVDDDAMERARSNYNAFDAQALFDCIHEIKGVSGGMEMTALYSASSEMVAMLRAGAEKAELSDVMERVSSAYERAKQGVEASLK